MKKIILIAATLLLLIHAVPGNAQQSLNEQLRELFTPLAKAPSPAPFLWDMAIHTTDEKFYKALCYDSSNTTNWWALYYEMYHAAYDTTLIPSPDSFLRAVQKHTKIDTVPIGLFDFEYNTFLIEALDTFSNGQWFIWDDDTIYDNVHRADEPYMENPYDPSKGLKHEIFAVAPMQRGIRFSEVYFKIDPELILYDVAYNSNVAAHPSPHTFQMNFDDGMGWITIDPNTTSYIHVSYPDDGYKLIKARVQDEDITIKYSQSAFTVSTTLRKKKSDFDITAISGLDVGVYLDCSDSVFDKPFIILSGIDITESTDVPELYQDYVLESKLVMLKNYGYDFVIVDWRNSKDDMNNNRDRVISLIEHLKCQMEGDEQFVVMGISMGGVIGRAALTVMESDGYWGGGPDSIGCRPNKQRHNTRLFISADAPQRGAHVPLAYQHMYDYVANLPSVLRPDLAMVWLAIRTILPNKYDILQSDAVEQLLVYQSSMGLVTGHYPAHPAYSQFYGDLQVSNGNFGYPQYCKNVAISDGLFDGSHQVGFSNTVMNGGERLMDLSLSVDIAFLRLWRFPLIKVSPLKMYANQGSGTHIVMQWPLNYNTFSLKGCLKSIFKYRPSGGTFVLCGANSIQLPYIKLGTDLEPLEAMPGGTGTGFGSLFLEDMVGVDYNPIRGILSWVYNFQFVKNPMTGVVSIQTQLASLTGFTMSIEADYVDAGFVPLVSAFDIRSPRPPAGPTPTIFPKLDSNFLNTDIDSLMSIMTPFDVLIGFARYSDYPTLNGPLGSENESHVTIPTDTFKISGVNTNDHITTLCMEAGYDHMFLDNMKLNRRAEYTCYGDIHAGYKQNPKYFYDGTISPTDKYQASRADKKGFEIIDGGDVIFRANDEIVLSRGFSVTGGGEFRTILDPKTPCTKSYPQYVIDEQLPPMFLSVDSTETVKVSNDLLVYPNPASSVVNLALKSPDNNIKQLVMMDMQGKIIFKVINLTAKTMEIDLSSLYIPAGVYTFIVQTDNGTYHQRIIINHEK